MASGDTLENLLNSATSPINRDYDWEKVIAFCDQVNRDVDGPQIAAKLLSHKIQSPQEWEALLALSVLEQCAKNCERPFHTEIGKFRFLNEMIKLVSPKYLGNRTSSKVHAKVVEIIYSWTLSIPHESKIKEAYDMLKRQGIVKHDPVLPHTRLKGDDDALLEPNQTNQSSIAAAPIHLTPRKNEIQMDTEKQKLLSKLLRSRNPEDLQAANRLIKNLVREDALKSEKVSKRITELETVKNNTKLLSDMVSNFSQQHSTDADRELMKELYEACEKLRPNLFRLASETDDESIADVLKANDELTQVMEKYKSISVQGNEYNIVDVTAEAKQPENPWLDFVETPKTASNATGSAREPPSDSHDSMLLEIDLNNLGLQDVNNTHSSSPKIVSSVPPPTAPPIASTTAGDLSELKDVFAGGAPVTTVAVPLLPPQVAPSLLGDSVALHPVFSQASSALPAPITLDSVVFGDGPPPLVPHKPTSSSPLKMSTTQNSTKGLSEIDELGKKLIEQQLPVDVQPIGQTRFQAQAKVPMSQLQTSVARTANNKSLPNSPSQIQPLTDLFIALENILPGELPPMTIYDKNGLRTIMHFAKNTPRDDVSVLVISTMNTSTMPVHGFNFQVAVPKVMRVKLQPASATDLPAFNPILPTATITQVMLLANPNKEKIKLKYKIIFTINDKPFVETGDVDTFPFP